MSVSKDCSKKAPSQNPTDFYKMQKPPATPQKVPDVLKGGPMREAVYGHKSGK